MRIRTSATDTALFLTVALYAEGFHVPMQRRHKTFSFFALKEPIQIAQGEPHVEDNEQLEVSTMNATITRTTIGSTPTVPQTHDGAIVDERSADVEVSRRDWLKMGTVLVCGTIIGGATLERSVEQSLIDEPVVHAEKKLAPVNLTKAARETTINVTLDYPKTLVSIDKTTFQKKRNIKLPDWVPPYLVPKPVVVRDITNSELLAAAVVAGSAMEMARTTILYPLLTLKSRIQNDINHRQRKRGNKRLHPKRRLKVMGLNVKRHLREGQLYAGIVPSLVVSVPATGVYYGVRDIVKKAINMLPGLTDVEIAVVAALIADVISLIIRTPADALAVRRQVATGEESHDEETGEHTDVDAIVGNWFIESIERLPAIILTDLPYLLSRIAINRTVIKGDVNLGRYEAVAITTAVLCAFLTTPFDVARTRILLDSDDDPTNGIDGGSGEGLVRTFQTITKEGDGGVRNLFAGWLERTAYLGIGRAWLEPLQLLGYMWIRDAILLEWFD